jgi:hypothetical protein
MGCPPGSATEIKGHRSRLPEHASFVTNLASLVRSGNLVSHRGITDATGAAGRDSRPRAGPQGGLGLRAIRALQHSD